VHRAACFLLGKDPFGKDTADCVKLTKSYFLWFVRFCRGSVQTTLPPNRKSRGGRLCSSIEEEISDIGKEISKVQVLIQEGRGRKRSAQEAVRDLEGRVQTVKVRIINTILHLFFVL